MCIILLLQHDLTFTTHERHLIRKQCARGYIYTPIYIYIYIYILLSIFGVDAGVMFTMKIDDFEGGAQVTKPKLLNARE